MESKHKKNELYKGKIMEVEITHFHNCSKDQKFEYVGEKREPKIDEWFEGEKYGAIKNTPCPNGMTQAGEFEILQIKK